MDLSLISFIFSFICCIICILAFTSTIKENNSIRNELAKQNAKYKSLRRDYHKLYNIMTYKTNKGNTDCANIIEKISED